MTVTWRPARLLFAEDNPAGAVYGTVAAGAVLAVESEYRQTLGEAVSAVVLTVVLYWLAHAYAAVASERLRAAGRAWTVRRVLGVLAHEFAIVQGCFVPVVVLLAAAAAGASVRTAEVVAVSGAAALLVVLEVAGGWRAGHRGITLVGEAAVGAALGLGVLALKVVLK